MTRREELERAYLAGFNASGEGWNGEYPFEQYNKSPEEHAQILLLAFLMALVDPQVLGRIPAEIINAYEAAKGAP